MLKLKMFALKRTVKIKDKPWTWGIYLKITLYSEHRKLILELY